MFDFCNYMSINTIEAGDCPFISFLKGTFFITNFNKFIL
jgi:hypothetical protein